MEERSEERGQSQKTSRSKLFFKILILALIKNSTTQKKKERGAGRKNRQDTKKRAKKGGVTIVYSEKMFHVKHFLFAPAEKGAGLSSLS